MLNNKKRKHKMADRMLHARGEQLASWRMNLELFVVVEQLGCD
jgi:hypothetical protein